MANNPYVNKVTIGSQTVLDLTGDTVDAAHLAKGYTAHNMAGESIVGTMEAGGRGPTPTELTLTGDCDYMFHGGNWDWFVTKYGNQITTNNVSNCNSMFNFTNLQSIPFNINLGTSTVNLTSMFGSSKLRTLPYLYNPKPSAISTMFYFIQDLRNIPDDYFDTWDFSASTNGIQATQVFYGCWSLRKIPETFFDKFELNLYSSKSFTNFLLHYFVADCCSLDELTNVTFNPLWKGTSNYMGDTVSKCSRLKDFKFKLSQDNTPKTGLFKNQIFDFSRNTGWGEFYTEDYILNYNSGITGAKKVTDATSYNLLKDDPDWYTLDVNYSRYNHDSAVNTINTLPDTSATGTNTIKFKGQAGALTDGGAINTLTTQEIAVATAKGWTVTFV